MNKYQASKPVSMINSVKELKEELDDTDINIRLEETVKLHLFLVPELITSRRFHNCQKKSPLANTK